MSSMTFQTLLGRSVAMARIRLGLSTPELSERTGLNPLRVALIEEGKVDAEPFELAHLADALRVSVERLCPDFSSVASHFDKRISALEQVKGLKVRAAAHHSKTFDFERDHV